MQKTGTSINPPPPEPGIVGGGGGCEGGWARPKKGGKKYNLTRYAIITWEIIRFSLTHNMWGYAIITLDTQLEQGGVAALPV